MFLFLWGALLLFVQTVHFSPGLQAISPGMEHVNQFFPLKKNLYEFVLQSVLITHNTSMGVIRR